jgi:hypothetical protein
LVRGQRVRARRRAQGFERRGDERVREVVTAGVDSWARCLGWVGVFEVRRRGAVVRCGVC